MGDNDQVQLKLSKLPWTFEGKDGESIRTFLSKAKATCTAAGVEEYEKIQLVRLAMKDKAADWVEMIEVKGEYDDASKAILATWAAFEKELERRWAPKRTPDEIAVLIKSLSMKKSESVEDFFERCERVAMEKDHKRSADEKKTELYKAMHLEDIQNFLLGGLPMTIKTALPPIPDDTTLPKFKELVLTTYSKLKRDGGCTAAGGSPNAKVSNKIEVAGVEIAEVSKEISTLTKRFVKWAERQEANGSLKGSTFSVSKEPASSSNDSTVSVDAVTSGSRGRGRGRGQRRGGRSSRGGSRPQQQQVQSTYNCYVCDSPEHGYKDCPVRSNIMRPRSNPQSAPIHALTYANAAAQAQNTDRQLVPVQNVQQRTQQPQQPGSLFQNEWGF